MRSVIIIKPEMSKYLSKSHNSLFIEETHQHYADFISPTTGCKITKREISQNLSQIAVKAIFQPGLMFQNLFLILAEYQ